MPIVDERKSLFARRDLVDKLNEIANRRDISLYNFLNEILESYIRIFEETSLTPIELIEFTQFYSKISGMDFIPVPKSTWILLLKSCISIDNLKQELYQLGVKLIKYYKASSGNITNDILRDLSRVFNWIGDISVKTRENTIEILISSPILSHNEISYLLEVYRGALSELGYTLKELVEIENVMKAVFIGEKGARS